MKRIIGKPSLENRKNTQTSSGVQPGVVTLDLHGMTVYQARVAAEATLRRADKSVWRIRFVHGYHLGAGIRDMLRTEFSGDPRVHRLVPETDGITALELRSLNRS